MGLFDDLLAGDGSQQPKAQSENTGSSINIDALPQGLKSYAKDFEEAGSKYGIDPNFLAAISWNETGGGTSKAFRSGNNAMGISNASGPLYGFNSVADSINRQAATLARPNGPYKGASTIQEIGSIYSPVGAVNDPYHLNADWIGSVGNFYNKLTGRGNNAPVLGAGQQVAQPKTSGLFDDLLGSAQEQAQPSASPSPTPEQTGKVINLPAMNPIENALRNFANTAATSTINSIGGAVRYFGGAQQKDLKMAQDELAQAKSSGASEDNLSEIQGRIDKIQSQLGSTKEASSSLSDLSSQYPAAYGVNPEDKSVSAQIGRGLGGVTAMLPIMSTGPAGMALGGLQGASTAYEDAYQQSVQNLKNQGVTDQSSIDDQAQKEASIAAVKTLPQLGVYMIGGKLASEGVSKLLSTQTPLIQGVAGAVAGSIANTAAGATIRKFMGENVMPTAESLTQDIAFGLFHGVGTGVEAQEKLRQQQQAKAKLDAQTGGPAPQVAPSANPVVNEREAKINAMADAQSPAPEAPKPVETAPVAPEKPETPADVKLTKLLTEQLFHDEGSEKWNEIQSQIDAINKPTGEAATALVAGSPENRDSLNARAKELGYNSIEQFNTQNVLKGNLSPEEEQLLRDYADHNTAARTEKDPAKLAKMDDKDFDSWIKTNTNLTADAQISRLEDLDSHALALEAARKRGNQKLIDVLTEKINQSGPMRFKSVEEMREFDPNATQEDFEANQRSADEFEAYKNSVLEKLGLKEKPAEAPAEAQPTTPNAVQEPSAREVGVRNTPAVGEGVGAENKSEVPTQEGQAPKEEVKPQEVQLTDEQQAEKVLLDKIDAASGKPKAPAPYAGVAASGGENQGVGISKEAVNNQRLARMVESLPESEREPNAEKINDALEKNKNPNFVEGLVYDIFDMGKTLATPEEVALMTVELNRLQLERQRVQENFEQTEKRPSDYSILNSEIKPIDDKIDRLERAVDKVGTNAGRLLQMFKIMLAEDYSPIALEKKAERQLRRELTPEEKNTIAEQARQIKELQDKLNNNQAKAEDTALNQSVKEAYERQIAELKEQSKPDPSVQKILDKVADFLKSPADKARERMAQRRKEGRLFAGIPDPTLLADVALLGAEKIAKGASNLAKWTSQMRSEYGEGILPHIKEIWNKSLEIFKAASEKQTSKASEKVKAKIKRVAKEEATREDIINRAKAEAEAGEELSHATVYDLARSHILEGMRGEDNIMKAVHDDIKEAYPNASERDVRRAFSEYGKAKFPSLEEDKFQLRQLRTLVRLQESIDRLKGGLPALRTGLQRDRFTQAIREKQTILNNLLKEVKLEPTTEELTSRLEAKKNALRNRIEDLDAQLKGKAKRIEKGTSVPLDAEAERLTSLRDAMQEKLREVEAEERKSKEKTPEQKYNERRIADAKKKIAEIEDKMRRGDYSKAEKRKPLVKYPETELVEKQLAEKRREADLWREEKEKSERPRWEKALRTTSETAREVTVAGINVLYKIGKYAIAKPITTPIGEIVGYTARQLGGLGKVRGEFESGASPLKTIPAYYRGYWKAMKQFMRVVKSGHSDSELLYDKQKQNNTNWFRWIGSNLHAAIKNLPSTAKEELYREHLYANAIADGLIDPKNPSDPKNQMAIAGLNLKAYLASKAEKLQEDNKISEAINNIHRWAESPDKEGKINPYTSLTSHLVKIAITKGIYKIGLNYLKQAGQAATGLPRGMVSLLNAYWEGLDTLTPKEMDYITKAFKVGSVPAALMVWAAIDAFKDDKDKVFGGYYEQGRKKGDVKWGDVRINGKQFSLHIPEVEAAQFVNTMARDFRKNASKTDLTMNLIESFFDAMKGVFSEAPITGPVTEIAKSPKSFAGYLIQGQVPSAVRDVAKMRDVNAEGEPNYRYTKTALDNLKKGIPGLRETLPATPQRSKTTSNSSRPWYEQSSKSSSSKPWYEKK